MSKGVTNYLIFVVISILLSAFQYGYHNGELNTPQDVISKCTHPNLLPNFLPPCIPMPDSEYALVVSILTAGGLVGALIAPVFNDRYGRRSTLFGTNLLLSTGSLMATLASSPRGMMMGRFLSGVGSGIVTVVVPAYIAECVTKSQRGFFGALNQLAIVLGIMVAQVVGLGWATISHWRYILAMGFVVAVLQSCLLPFCVESPRYLASIPGGSNSAMKSLLKLRGTSADEVEDEINEWQREWADNTENQTATAQIDEEDNYRDDERLIQSPASEHVNVWKFLSLKQYRRPLIITLILQMSQQLSGINAVIFYSTSIMSSVFPESSSLITVYISIVNLLMTAISAYLMDKLGRRPLFLFSGFFMALTSGLLGWSIENGYNMTSAFAILVFVALFAIGLGPIPFLMIPEVVDTKAVSSACSVGLATNMISNFAVSSGFLVLRNMIGQGYVFFLYSTASLVLFSFAFYILPETKDRSADDLIRSGYSIYPCHYESF
ncbi:general substrate transporter [Blakeslea trispora]|nr:general substrate transporter [Blakeslea trispora]